MTTLTESILSNIQQSIDHTTVISNTIIKIISFAFLLHVVDFLEGDARGIYVRHLSSDVQGPDAVEKSARRP